MDRSLGDHGYIGRFASPIVRPYFTIEVVSQYIV
jgi:hypothetical protein